MAHKLTIILSHLNSELQKVGYSKVSGINMVRIQIPTVYYFSVVKFPLFRSVQLCFPTEHPNIKVVVFNCKLSVIFIS